MKYKDYTARIEFDDSINALFGRVQGLRTIVTFEGQSVDELESAFHEAVDDYLDYCTEKGLPPEKPYSGRFNVRLQPDLHRRAAMAAEEHGESLNAFVEHCIQNAVGH